MPRATGPIGYIEHRARSSVWCVIKTRRLLMSSTCVRSKGMSRWRTSSAISGGL